MRTFVDLYLSEAHRDDRAGGCGFAALGAELGRADASTRAEASAALRHYVATIASFLPGVAPAQATRKAQAIAATLLGAITMARAVSEASLAREVLDSARESVIALVSAAAKPRRRRSEMS